MAEEDINKLKQDLICLQGELDSLDEKIENSAARNILKIVLRSLYLEENLK